MTESAGLRALLRDALARHGGLLPLLRGLWGIAAREGLSGLLARRRGHGRRLSPASVQAQGEAPGRELEAGLNLVGHPYAVLGRAEDIRTAALACGEASIPFGITSLYGAYGSENTALYPQFPFFSRVGAGGRRRGNLFFLNADEMGPALERLGPEVFQGPRNIGCFAWELSRFPEAWRDSFSPLHEIWAPTRFIRDAIAPLTSLPITLMPFAVEPGPASPLEREALGLARENFTFLFFFDFRSYVQRKNPWAVLEAFSHAFPPGGNAAVQLVIKVNGVKDKPEDYARFLAHPLVADSRVKLIEQVMSDREIKGLVLACDCFVSLHRSEGFGRGLAEAMYYAKPVIGTNYSGNTDFMTADNSCLVDYSLVPLQAGDYPHGEGQVWAEADVEHAAWYMAKLLREPAYARGIGEAAEGFMRAHHSYREVGRQYRARLERLGLL